MVDVKLDDDNCGPKQLTTYNFAVCCDKPFLQRCVAHIAMFCAPPLAGSGSGGFRLRGWVGFYTAQKTRIVLGRN